MAFIDDARALSTHYFIVTRHRFNYAASYNTLWAAESFLAVGESLPNLSIKVGSSSVFICQNCRRRVRYLIKYFCWFAFILIA